MAAEPKSERFIFSASKAFFERVDHWRAKQPDIPSRAEAIRRLVEKSLDQP
ncbi:hypothetical protein [Novosphingobium sp. CF614]|uniref:hypothetical protein n=1 Tax=Novosphingobium sp. CF614 TaxID=1884364 RepID=UPI0015A6C279|nr:hypothetical protein [Novosphingobium sp. CF614]